MEKPTFVIDGNNFHDLEGLYDEVEKSLIPDVEWGRNLDALNDILRGDFGPLPRAFILVWKNIEKSKRDFGYEAIVLFWQQVIARWNRKIQLLQEQSNNSTNLSEKEHVLRKDTLKGSKETVIDLNEKLKLAQQEQGPTIFSWIIEMISDDDKHIEFRPE